MGVKKISAIAASIVLALSLGSETAAAATGKATGTYGQYITVSSTKLASGSKVTIIGRGFDETVGIYLGFCLVPKKNTLPSPCGGGVNKEGASASSLWISSNPPAYGAGAATAFLPGGRFKSTMRISRMIGKIDCSKTTCAITVRADHLRSQDRSHDLFIPVTFK
jgi:hypothetical protein